MYVADTTQQISRLRRKRVPWGSMYLWRSGWPEVFELMLERPVLSTPNETPPKFNGLLGILWAFEFIASDEPSAASSLVTARPSQ